MKKLLYILLFVPLALFGQDEYSLSFDGEDDYVEISNSLDFDLGDFTIIFKFKTPSIFPNSLQGLVSKSCSGCEATLGDWFISYNHTDSGRVMLFTEKGGLDGFARTGVLALDTWYNIGVRRIESTGELFITSNIIGAITDTTVNESGAPTGIINNTESFVFGNMMTTASPYEFEGFIDDVSLWNFNMSYQTMKDYMNCSPSGDEEGLVGYWNFNKGEGNTVYDLSGNGNDGTIYGATYSEDVTENNCNTEKIQVPSDYSTIQEAINASNNRDTVYVSSGVYQENIDFKGKNIVLKGVSSDSTTIAGVGDENPVVTIGSGEDTTSVLSGFTISGGLNGGIRITDASPRLIDLVIENNQDTDGGGIYISNSQNTVITNSIIKDNSSESHGGGIAVFDSSDIEIRNCKISNNSSITGGGIYSANSELEISHTVIYENESTNDGGGITISSYSSNGSSLSLSNATLYSNSSINTPQAGGIILAGSNSSASISNSIIWDRIQGSNFELSYTNIQLELNSGVEIVSGQGNIDSVALFVDAEEGDFSLQKGSPCIDAGDPEDELDPDGTRADIGAFYFDQGEPIVIYGCTDEVACNFNPESNMADVSCSYEECSEITGFNYLGSLNGSSYYVSENTSSWLSNKKICEDAVGHLAVIASEEENNFISQLIQQNYDDNLVFHIGFSDENSEDNWFWVNGEEFNYSNWAESEPSNSWGGEHYGQIYWSGYWNDIRSNDGSDANRAILEIQYQSSNNDENTDIDTIEIENVPNDYSTIQEAIDASSDGDTIMVSPGIYYENDITFNGKKIILLSSEGPENTIIDGSDSGRIFDITQGESFDTEIIGFTIQNGNHSTGSAIRIINDSYLTVKNCIIQNNNAPGIWTRAAVTIGQEYNNGPHTPAAAKFTNTSFINNSGYYGAAVFNEESGEQSSEFIECIFDSNNGYHGAAIFGTRNSIIRNSIFIDNYTRGPSNAIIQNEGGNPEIINSVFYNNQSYVLARNSSLPTQIINCVSMNNYGFINLIETEDNLIQVSYSNIEGGYEGDGNIDIDPLFVNAEEGVFSLQKGSPCIDAGNPEDELDPDGTRADIGAFYFHQTFGCTDSLMYNFNDEANTDDGSCEPYTYGCMDSTAINYEESINLDDESCEYDLTANAFSGCNDPDADNYNTNATSNDSSCFYNHQLLESFDMTFDSYFYYESNVLEEEESYKVIVSGSYGVAWNNGKDAAYYYQCCDWPDDEILVSNSIWSEGISYRPITNHYKEHHEYIYSFSGFNEPIVFEFIDNGGYGDNFGSLQIEIWKENLDKEQDSLFGCTDSLMYNFNDEANTDDGSCISIEEFTIDSLQEALSVFETVSHEEDYSMSFDGASDYVYLGNIFDVGSNSFNISFWASVDKLNLPTQQNIISKTWLWGYKIDLTNFSENIRFHLKGNNDSLAHILISNEIDLSQWFHVSGQVDRTSNNAQLYINGILTDSIDITELGDLNNIGELHLGCHFWQSNKQIAEFFNGHISHLSIWNKAFSNADIKSLMTCPPTGDEEGLVGYWNFNEGSGDTLYDISGNGNHGVIHGATYSEDVPDSQKGCTDVKALNYDETALCDNGSCVYAGDQYTLLEEENLVLSDSLSTSQQNLTLLEGDASTSLSSMQLALDSWNTTIDLAAGWNMFGYGCPAPIDLVQAISEHTDNIIILKDNNGNAYMPEYGFNGIGDLSPGLGYQIKVTEAIEGFSLCDWYVNDIPEDNIVSLQEELASAKAELDSLYGCMDEGACNFDSTAVLNDSSCDYETCLDECGVINGDNTTCLDCAGVPNGTAEDLGCGCGNPAAQEGYDCEGNEITSYQVGDLAHGGMVFYVDETGQHGLVAALEDLTEGATDPYGWGFIAYEWGCYGESVNGADGQAIGTGYQNTLEIVNQGCTTYYGGITAAQAALDAEINGYSDWYIPSKDELIEMYYTIGNGGSEGNIGGFDTSDWPYYWSSSEYDVNFTWYVGFDNGSSYNYYKDTAYRVRVIRAF